MKKTSVLFVLLGLMFIMIGFNGYMAHTFSSTMSEINGTKLVKIDDLDDELEKNQEVCILSSIYSDDIFEMPDNHQKVIKGKLYLSAIWPDSSQTVLINWNKNANYIRLGKNGDQKGEPIQPRKMECMTDTSIINQHLKITHTSKTVTVQYYQYKFSLNSIYTKGRPTILLQREYLENGTDVVATIEKELSGQNTIMNIVPYKVAMERENRISKSQTIYLILALIGVSMLFVPENKAINTINNIQMIGNKILNGN